MSARRRAATAPAMSRIENVKKTIEEFEKRFFDEKRGPLRELMCEDCTVQPPGVPPMPFDAFKSMIRGFQQGFKDWTGVFTFMQENEDGTFYVKTQHRIGVLSSDVPASGPFPAIIRANVPTGSLLLTAPGPITPFERTTWTFNEDGTKVKTCGDFVIMDEPSDSNTLAFDPPVGPPMIYGLAGISLPKPEMSRTDVVKKTIEEFAKRFYSEKHGPLSDLTTEDATMQPPGVPPMPCNDFVGMIRSFQRGFKDWTGEFKFVQENEDGTVTVKTQQRVGTLSTDVPPIGPFPAIIRANVPTDSLLLTKPGPILPFERAIWIFNEDGTKVKSMKWLDIMENQDTDVNTLKFSPPVGPPLLYTLAGIKLPEPMETA